MNESIHHTDSYLKCKEKELYLYLKVSTAEDMCQK